MSKTDEATSKGAAVKLAIASLHLTVSAANRITVYNSQKSARDETANIAASSALLLSITKAAHQAHKLTGDLSAHELEIEVALIAVQQLDSLRTAEAAAQAALVLELTLASHKEEEELEREEAKGVALAAELAKKIALDEATAVSLAAELEVERKLEEGRTKIRDALKKGHLCGVDDMGNSFVSLSELSLWQDSNRTALYAANAVWWDAGGYCGSTDEEAMMGDDESDKDIEDSSRFLTALLKRLPRLKVTLGLDAGAGVGRVTKHLLLQHCKMVHLVEASPVWSRQSRRYLGKKRGKSCTFACSRLEEFVPKLGSVDLVWIQWVLQYLTDSDAVKTLGNLKTGLTTHGVLVLKENRPYLKGCNQRMFQCDTPEGENKRFDITRSDAHHRELFKRAELEVFDMEQGEETNFWVLR